MHLLFEWSAFAVLEGFEQLVATDLAHFWGLISRFLAEHLLVVDIVTLSSLIKTDDNLSSIFQPDCHFAN